MTNDLCYEEDIYLELDEYKKPRLESVKFLNQELIVMYDFANQKMFSITFLSPLEFEIDEG